MSTYRLSRLGSLRAERETGIWRVKSWTIRQFVSSEAHLLCGLTLNGFRGMTPACCLEAWRCFESLEVCSERPTSQRWRCWWRPILAGVKSLKTLLVVVAACTIRSACVKIALDSALDLDLARCHCCCHSLCRPRQRALSRAPPTALVHDVEDALHASSQTYLDYSPRC
jgi:hypothetical protein